MIASAPLSLHNEKVRKNSLKTNGISASVLLVLLLGVAVISASVLFFRQMNSTDPRSDASTPANSFVQRRGSQFYLADQEFIFVGFNLFDAAGSGDSPYSCLQTNGWWQKFSNAEIDAALKSMKAETGATVLRFWAFQTYTKGGTDYSGIDKLIRLAKLNGFKIMPVFEDGPGYCTEPGGGGNNRMDKWKYQSDSWYTEGYKVANAPYTLSYRDYVQQFVTRYKDEPTIFGWMLVNEADTSRKVMNDSGKLVSALVPFAKDMSEVVKSIDSNHLVTVGTQSNGASGATGQDFIDVYSLPSIDFAEAHDWGYWGNDAESIVGGIRNADGTMSLPDPLSAECLKTYQAKIGCTLAQAEKIIQKPMVIGESGITARDTAARQRRAEQIDAKMRDFFANGGDGYLYWQWNKVVDSQGYDVLPGTNDPLLAVMKKYAGLSLSADVTVATPSPLVASLLPSPATPRPMPTRIPVASVSPITRVSPNPTAKPPSAPSPRPSIPPSPPPATTQIEGEALTADAQKSTIITDSGVTALRLDSNTTATGMIQGPIKQLTLVARPTFCLGQPHLNIKLNGQYIMDFNVTKAGFNEYYSRDVSRIANNAQSYKVEIMYNNDAKFVTCDRSVMIDVVRAKQ